MTTRLQVALTVRELDAADLSELSWTGGEPHLQAIADGLVQHYAGSAVHLVVELPNHQLIGHGVVDFRPAAESGLIMMLAVRPSWQSLGVGTALITALEQRIRDGGRARAQITVEHDNPDAARLYRRLGYREVGTALDQWTEGHGRTYVSVCSVLAKPL